MGHLYIGRPRSAVAAFVIFNLVVAGSYAATLLPSLGLLGLWLCIPVSIIAWATPAFLAGRAARRISDYVLKPYNVWFIYPLILVADIALGGPFGPIRHYVVKPFRMPSPSMEPTIIPGDDFFVSRLPSARRTPARGTIVVYQSVTASDVFVIKRVVGLSGDTLAMRHGALVRDGRFVPERYVEHIDSAAASQTPTDWIWQIPLLVGGYRDGYRPTASDWGPLVVPNGTMFVLGDNRDNSYDSRFFGPVPLRNLQGVPIVIYFSRNDSVPEAAYAVRWERIGRRF